ncbi:MAG: hypothetical protein L6R43_17345, partial [Planctomycetes bacterium]|nr:hypothetical protein [Planctomycetota bacterium]
MKERGLRGAAAGGLALLGAAVLVAGCQTETRTVGPDAVEAAARGGWAVSGGAGGDGGGRPGGAPSGEGDSPHDALFDPPPRDPSDVVQVPVEAYAPVDRFFDNEGFLLGDRVEVDCSAEPFMARLIALAYADANGKYVVREEGREGDVHVVRLRNEASGVNYQSNLVPKATFGSQRGVGAKEDPRTGEVLSVNVRPFFEIV